MFCLKYNICFSVERDYIPNRAVKSNLTQCEPINVPQGAGENNKVIIIIYFPII